MLYIIIILISLAAVIFIFKVIQIKRRNSRNDKKVEEIIIKDDNLKSKQKNELIKKSNINKTYKDNSHLMIGDTIQDLIRGVGLIIDINEGEKSTIKVRFEDSSLIHILIRDQITIKKLDHVESKYKEVINERNNAITNKELRIWKVTDFIKIPQIKFLLDKYIVKSKFEEFDLFLYETNNRNYLFLARAIKFVIRKEIFLEINQFPIPWWPPKIRKNISYLESNKLINTNQINYLVEIVKNHSEEFEFNYSNIFLLTMIHNSRWKNEIDWELFESPKIEYINDLKAMHRNFAQNLMSQLISDNNRDKVKVMSRIFANTKYLIIDAQPDFIIDDAIVEIKTSIKPKIQKSYLYQLLIYAFVYEEQIGNKINYIKILNPRAKNIITIRIDDLVSNWSDFKNSLRSFNFKDI